MKVRMLAAAAGTALALTLAGTACSSDSYNRDDAISDLTEAGLTEEQATCVVDAVEDEFGIEKLESDDELTAEDTQKLGEITTECMGLGDLGDLEVPDDSVAG